MRALAIAALLAAPSVAVAQELVTVPTRPGVTQSFFIPGMERKPQAIALLYIYPGIPIYIATTSRSTISGAAGLGEKFPLVSVSGGKRPESGPCDPYSAHGFYGKEAGTVDAISAWMLNKPFSRSIE